MFSFHHVLPLFLVVLLPSPFCVGNLLNDTEILNLPILASSSSPKWVNVDYYGAKGDGSDDSQAFKKAWEVACAAKNGILWVPRNRVYLLKPTTFSGPCNSVSTVRIYGTIKASRNPSDYHKSAGHWLLFQNIRNFRVEGSGTIDGSGEIWWKNSCKINPNRPCKDAPTAVTFYGCNYLSVSGIRVQNPQQMHMVFEKCVNVNAWNLKVIAPETSPNTDGIHITDTQNIQVSKSTIKTGDDCISIVDGAANVRVMDIDCGPGHGISIGSLGKHNSRDLVSNVNVNGVRFSGTTNGVRIKTWQGGSGYAKDIVFQNIAMTNVKNPIIVDQNYCDQNKPCNTQWSAVQVENVRYINIKGSSASEEAITFDCSGSFPCKEITLQDIVLVRQSPETAPKASCQNVKLKKLGTVWPACS
ncbi:Polygalacturonase [Bertholletia excelsa]